MGLSLVVLAGVVVNESLKGKVLLALLLGYLLYRAYDIWRQYNDWLIRDSMAIGKKIAPLPTFGSKDKEIYADCFGWKTAGSVGFDEGGKGGSADYLVHHDGAVSIGFEWQGMHNRYFDEGQFRDEHKRRVALLKQFSDKNGLVIETHLVRQPDSRLVDAYEAEGRVMFKGKEPPKIIGDIRKGIADMGRLYGRSNRVMTVLSLGPDQTKGFLSWVLPQVAKRTQSQEWKAQELLQLYKRIERDFTGAKLLNKTQYLDWIQRIDKPYSEGGSIDWRFALNEQTVTDKPKWDESKGCLAREGQFYKVCLLQGYPDLDFNWVFQLTEAGVDLHISQIIKPKNTQKSLDSNLKQAALERGASNENKSLDMLSARLRDLASFRAHVADCDLDVFDNAYIVTFTSRDSHWFDAPFDAFRRSVEKRGGLLRVEQDLQQEMFRVRLPGLGRGSAFLREDHSETVAAMMPMTTYPIGQEKPEVLRIAATGNLVGFSPSKQRVRHEMVVAETDGGKDTQFGAKIAETYTRIRYDIVELGNSYQGIIEAIGGRYCRAREQVINPLMSYADYVGSIRSASELGVEGVCNTTIEAQVLASQVMILNPLFKGMKGKNFINAEEVVLGRALRWLYENPTNEVESPTLPMILAAFDEVGVEKAALEQARNELGEELYLFLEKPGGQPFKEQGQFTISPIANAIDFDKFDGELADFFLSFMCVRLANNAFARGACSQIVLNEYKMLLQKSPEAIRWISLAIDRMGRKDWVGLTRISQGYSEIQQVDAESNSSIVNRTVLSRVDQHESIAQALNMPGSSAQYWKHFRTPKQYPNMDYREAFVCEEDTWHHLYLRFPEIALKVMNTDPNNKALREQAYRQSTDAYERIHILDELMKTQLEKEKTERKVYEKPIKNTALV
ncbi:MAG: hypothetical protein KUG81_10540 [Gammaproteobacteria bacterium]|nr:hypothetical protein [Gammaproteobacteria bacterium]